MPPPRNTESHPVATPLLGSESLKGERSELRAISNRARRAGRLRFSVLLISPLGGNSPPLHQIFFGRARGGAARIRNGGSRRRPQAASFCSRAEDAGNDYPPWPSIWLLGRGLFTRTLNYLEAPQRRYNIVATLGTWPVKIPVMGYFDDFGLISSVPPTGEASPEFSERNEIFGFVLRLSKSEWAGSSSFEGS